MINKELISFVEQGTKDWFKEKLSIPTSSKFKRIVTSTGLISKSSGLYEDELLAEFISKKTTYFHETKYMKDGTEREPFARAFYEFLHNVKVEEVGLVYKNKNKTISCSPDGLIKNSKGYYEKGLEIKCPKLSTQIKRVRENILPSEYQQQVQGSMWVTGLNQWDFFSYHPDFEPFLITVERDDDYISKLEKAVIDFSENLELKKRNYEWTISQHI